jgi:hypothetical protein
MRIINQARGYTAKSAGPSQGPGHGPSLPKLNLRGLVPQPSEGQIVNCRGPFNDTSLRPYLPT